MWPYHIRVGAQAVHVFFQKEYLAQSRQGAKEDKRLESGQVCPAGSEGYFRFDAHGLANYLARRRLIFR